MLGVSLTVLWLGGCRMAISRALGISLDGMTWQQMIKELKEVIPSHLPLSHPLQKLFRPSSPPHPVLPNLLEGVTIHHGPPHTYDECSVCLDDPVHPVTLPCSHVFCYLCGKGLTRQEGHLLALQKGHPSRLPGVCLGPVKGK